MRTSKSFGLVLAVHPTTNGFGWVLFEAPLSPVVWGIANAKDKRNATVMRRFETLLNQYRPSVLVLEEFAEGKARRSTRVQELMQTMSGFADNHDIEVAVYPREYVGLRVTGNSRASRHSVAEAVVRVFPILRARMPRERKLWQSEDPRQCLFDAAALAITHFEVAKPGG